MNQYFIKIMQTTLRTIYIYKVLRVYLIKNQFEPSSSKSELIRDAAQTGAGKRLIEKIWEQSKAII